MVPQREPHHSKPAPPEGANTDETPTADELPMDHPIKDSCLRASRPGGSYSTIPSWQRNRSFMIQAIKLLFFDAIQAINLLFFF
jgi:hypothetical protein